MVFSGSRVNEVRDRWQQCTWSKTLDSEIPLVAVYWICGGGNSLAKEAIFSGKAVVDMKQDR